MGCDCELLFGRRESVYFIFCCSLGFIFRVMICWHVVNFLYLYLSITYIGTLIINIFKQCIIQHYYIVRVTHY